MLRNVVQAFRRKAEATGDFALTILHVARDTMDAIPPAKIAFGGILSMVDIKRVSYVDPHMDDVSITTLFKYSAGQGYKGGRSSIAQPCCRD
jgi:hypothetical protein